MPCVSGLGIAYKGHLKALKVGSQEPEVLVKHRNNRANGDKKEKMRASTRRYAASMGGRDGNSDIRLHGRQLAF